MFNIHILYTIFKSLGKRDLFIVSHTCQYWRQVVHNPFFLKINNISIDDAVEFSFVDFLLVQQNLDVSEIVGMPNYFELLKQIHKSNQGEWNKFVYLFVSEIGDVECLKWLYLNRPMTIDIQLTGTASSRGHLNVLKFLHKKQNINPREIDMRFAALNGHLDVVIWMCSIGVTCTSKTVDSAIRRSRYDIVKWLIQNGYECLIREAVNSCIAHTKKDLMLWILSYDANQTVIAMKEDITKMKETIEKHEKKIDLINFQIECGLLGDRTMFDK